MAAKLPFKSGQPFTIGERPGRGTLEEVVEDFRASPTGRAIKGRRSRRNPYDRPGTPESRARDATIMGESEKD